MFLKSNGPLYEWLQSPIIYKSDGGFKDELHILMDKYFSLRSGGNHYLSMALNTVTNDLSDDKAKIKRYFYALRSALACKWIIERQSVPPMEFKKLRLLVNDGDFQTNVDRLLKIKEVSDEKTLVEHNAILDQWLEITLNTCKEKISLIPAKHQSPEELNIVFRKYILP